MTNKRFLSIILYVALGVKNVKISLKQLENSQGMPVYFEEEMQVEENLKSRDDTILAVSPAIAKGFLVYQNETVIAQFTCAVDITLPSSRSLEPVVVPLSIEIVERYIPKGTSFEEQELTEIVIPLETDWIDLQPAVEDHILLSIPLQVLSPEELSEDRMPSGQDWEVISQDELSLRRTVVKEQQIDPRLAALQSFFDSDETEK